MVYSILAIAFLSFIVWAHHMFMAGVNPFISNFFVIFTLSSLSILMIYGFKRSGIICHLMGLHQDNSWKAVYAAKKPAVTTAPEHEAA